MTPKVASVRIRNFEKYKGRSDVKHNSWFRCSNRLLEDPDFYEFSHAELLVWVYILSLASIKNSDEIEINFDRADKVCRLKKKDVLSALEKLEGNQIDRLTDTLTLRARYANDTSTCATEQDRQTEQTGQYSTAAEPLLHPLAVVWNENCGELSKVKEVGKERSRHIAERLRDCPSLATWAEVTKRIAASDFCNGRVDGKKWKATFDFLLRPKTRIKALEGAYDNFGATENGYDWADITNTKGAS